MARKTQNSSQTLPSAVAQTLQASEVPQQRTPSKKNKNASHTPATSTPRGTPQQSTSNGEDGAAESQRNGDDKMEMDAADDQLGKPAVLAPSVRPFKKGSEQAGLVENEKLKQYAAASALRESEESGYISDDEDYAAVNDISDSSDDEPDVPEITERIVMRNKDAHPTTNYLHWYEHEEKIQGMLGENESFFDQHLWDDWELSSALSDDFDYHTAWDGIPDTPIEPQTPMSLPSPSPRRVHFESQTSSSHPDNAGLGADQDPAATEPTTGQSPAEVDEEEAGSGYETEAETTDEEEPPIRSRVLAKAPHLLQLSPPLSINPSSVHHSRPPSSSEKGFKVPLKPASRPRKGPKLGTFKNAPSRSYTMYNEAGDDLIVYEAARPSPRPPLPQFQPEPALTEYAPPTPISHATLSLPPDLSETEFSDAVASQLSMDPVLSAGPDFIASAGFSQISPRIPEFAVPLQQSSELYPKDSFDATSFLDRQANGAEAQFDDPDDDEMGESAFENFIKWGESSSDEDSVISNSSHPNGTPAVGATSPSAQAPQTNSPSSASPNHGIDSFGGVDVSSWRNSANQKHQSRHLPKRPPHGLSLSGNGLKGSRHPPQPSNLNKKRKIGEIHGKRSPPMPSNKRRLPAVSR